MKMCKYILILFCVLYNLGDAFSVEIRPSAVEKTDTTWRWYRNNRLLLGETRSVIKGTGIPGTYQYRREAIVGGNVVAEFNITLNILPSGPDIPAPSSDTLIFRPDRVAGLHFAGDGMNLSFFSDKAWEITNCPDWLTVSPKNGNSGEQVLFLKVPPYNAVAPRQGEIVVRKGAKDYRLTISQNNTPGYREGFRLTSNDFAIENPLHIPYRGAVVSWNWYDGGFMWWYCMDEQIDWFHYTSAYPPDNQVFRSDIGISATFDENFSSTVRTKNIYLLTSFTRDTCMIYTVVQDGAENYLDLPFETYQARSKGEKKTFDVTSNCEWTVSSTEDWIVVEKKAENATTATLELTVKQNAGGERNGRVEFKSANGSVIRAITVEQAAYVPLTYPFDLKYKLKLKAYWASGSFYGVNGGRDNYANYVMYTSFTYSVPREVGFMGAGYYGFVTDPPYANTLETPMESHSEFYVPNYRGTSGSQNMELSITWGGSNVYLRRCAVVLPIPASLTAEDELTYTIDMYEIYSQIDFKYRITTEIK